MKRRSKAAKPMTNVELMHLPKYPIGVVSRILRLPPQALRRFEEAGLLEPARQDGKNRLYSDHDVATLEEIAELADCGVNAIGIRYILQMREQINHLQQEIKDTREGKED